MDSDCTVRMRALPAALLAGALMLAACSSDTDGGSGDRPVIERLGRVTAMLAAQAADAPMPSNPSSDELFDWAEREYPQWFPGPSPTRSAPPYTYRHYPQTGNYVGVAGDQVFVLGPISGGALTQAGTMADYRCRVVPSLCAAPTLTLQPADTVSQLGARAALRAAGSAAGAVRYQWYRAGVPIAGATSPELVIASVSFADDGVPYWVTLDNDYGSTLSRTAVLRVQPPSPPTELGACGEITAAGSYVLTADLSLAGAGTCITIRDTSSVQLDCAGHRISGDSAAGGQALALRQLRQFSVKNCQLRTRWTRGLGLSDGSITATTLAPPDGAAPAVFDIEDAVRVVFSGNRIAGGTYQQRYAQSVAIHGNHISAVAGSNGVPGTIISDWGQGNRVVGNRLEGLWNGQPGWNGADDGVVLLDEAYTVVEGNTMQDFFDCGVEWTGRIDNVVVRSNLIANVGFCGIGGWYWSSVVQSRFERNRIERAPQMLQIARIYGLRAAGHDDRKRWPADTGAEFRDNVFDGNALIESTIAGTSAAYLPVYDRLDYLGGISSLPGERPIASSEFHIANNLFRSNDFGHASLPPWFGNGPVVPGMIIDGGGNRCQASQRSGYPLRCE